MTFSIVGWCPETGQLGVAICSSLMAVAGRCAFARGGTGAVVVQNYADPRLGHHALDLLAGGYRPDGVIKALERSEDCFEYRQLALVNGEGNTAVYDGTHPVGLHGTAQGRHCAALGNRLADPGLPAAMVAAFASARGELADKLLAALHAAAAGGGETVPLHAAGLLVVESQAWPLADLRVDWSEDGPVAELERLWRRWRPQMRDYLTRALDPSAIADA
jgi:uncharacterized Ntn-hydrolase superfamily protein